MAELDWSLAQTPDIAGNALKASALGRQQGLDLARQNALRTFATDPNAGISQLMSVDPATAVTLQKAQAEQRQQASAVQAGQAAASGDMAGAQRVAAQSGNFDLVSKLQGMTKEQQDQANAVNDRFISAVGAVNNLPYEQRRAAIQSIKPQLTAAGVAPDRVDAYDPTDQNNAVLLQSALTRKDQIEQARQTRQDAKPSFTTFKDGSTERLVQTNPEADGAQFTEGRGWNGRAPPPAVAAPTPTPVAGQGSAPAAHVPGPVGQQITATAQANGATPDELAYLHRTAQIESNGDPNAQNGSSTGLFQFHPSTFQALGGGDIKDPRVQTARALELARQDGAALSQTLGRPATPDELYLAHQQGAPGAAALLAADPSASAVSVLTPLYRSADVAKKAITGNGGNPDMTAGQFVGMWRQRYAGAGAPQATDAPRASAAPPTAGPTGGWQPHTVMTGRAAPEIKELSGPDGSVQMYDVSDPAHPSVLPITGAPKAEWQVLTDPKTSTQYRYNSATGKATTLDGSAPYTPQGAAKIASGNARSAQAMATQRFLEEHPNATADDLTQFNAELGARSKAAKDFATGQQGKTVNSFNVAISHLDTLGQLADALQNGNIPVLNQVGNVWKQQTGQAAPNNFNAAKQIVADEIVKSVVGAGGSAGDRDKAQAVVNAANSPAQLKGVIQTYKGLMAGQLAGLKLQYHNSTGFDDFESKLSPATQAALEAHGAAAPAPAPAQGNAPPASALKPNVTTTFRNGQTWTLGPDGKPKRLR